MVPEKEEMFRQRQLALIGKILTGLTQETSNHLQTLQASAGRLFSFLGQANQESGEDYKKFADILSSIERHIKFLNQKSLHLHRFGLRMGTALSTFDPGEVIEEAVLFSTHLAHLYNVSLRLEVDETLPGLYSDPVYVHFLVSILIHSMLEQVGGDGKITVSARPIEKDLLIRVEGQGLFEATTPPNEEARSAYWSIGQRLVSDLRGRLQPEVMEHETKRITLFLPLRQASNKSEVKRDRKENHDALLNSFECYSANRVLENLGFQ